VNAVREEVNEENYLRVERAYGSSPAVSLLRAPRTQKAIKADYQNGVLTLSIPKREEAKPKQDQGQRRDSCDGRICFRQVTLAEPCVQR